MAEEPIKTSQNQVMRDARGRILPGYSGNIGGKPRGMTALKEIELAIEEFQEREGISYWKAVTELAWTLANKGKTELLGKLMDKFLPSKYEADLTARPFVKMGDVILKDGSPLSFDVGDQAGGALPEPPQ